MPEVYVALSIHGSMAFITANKIITEIPQTPTFFIDGKEFATGHSRTVSLRGATKLMALELKETPLTLQATKNVEKIREFFAYLGRYDWQIDNKAFENYWIKKANVAPTVANNKPKTLGKNKQAILTFLQKPDTVFPITAYDILNQKLFKYANNISNVYTVLLSLKKLNLIEYSEISEMVFRIIKPETVATENTPSITTAEPSTEETPSE